MATKDFRRNHKMVYSEANVEAKGVSTAITAKIAITAITRRQLTTSNLTIS